MTASRYKLTRDGGFTVKASHDLVRLLSVASAELRARKPKTNYWIHDGGSLVQVWLDERGEVHTQYYCNWGHRNDNLQDEVLRILTTYMPKRKEHS